ncbi:MAG: GntR family transcriptional regulator [Deltaproteobacteria bacterium]|nr:GntR family transcriptional regulator [Deltaproteobacteria bacterium]MBW1920584.1 GntR family transcriptional regulator [Deltaproteobacteria bacterium]MBW1934077.1 GntR family transcriptional regulator [Deltaproteobacteria bacterium]MBW1976351.1 GntR family transcriptional regulator [Deltaproteobacteria bacterium]MBW2043371.1 GntR family transcriptional regulator [Deltaproteobacteria bacterium]
MAGQVQTQGFTLRSLKSLPERKSLGQHVFENLKHAIIHGDILAGDRLVESRIADALNISRTPVREAIHKLEREGLLRKLPKGGFIVVNLTREDIEETFGIRSVLESYAARLAAEKHRKEELEPLEQKIQEFELCLKKGQVDELPRINTEFHNLFYALSRSPRLIKMINDLSDQIYRFRKIILRMNNMARTSNEDHRRMLEAIKKRDTKKVERLVREHILRGQKTVLKALDND